MEYTDVNKYAFDNIVAAAGTLLSEDYNVRDFENVTTPVCSIFINFVKSMSREQAQTYVTRENFNEYFYEKTQKSTFTEVEDVYAKFIFEHIKSNRASNNAGLKEPGLLYKNLAEAKKKIDLKKSITGVVSNEKFAMDPVTWGETYCEELNKSLSDVGIQYVSTGTDNKLLFADDLKEKYTKVLDERAKGEVYSFHNTIMDQLIPEGPTPGHGGIIGGSTGMGKSTLCLNVINDLIDADVPVMYFPIEMGVINTMDRLASLRTHIPFKDIIKIGKAEEVASAREVIDHEIDGLRAHTNFAIVDDANINMLKLRQYIQRFQAKLPGRKYCIVFIDLLLMIQEFYDDGNNMAQMIERAINKLDIMAKELGIHYVGVVQLNRSVEDGKPLSIQQLDKLRPTRSSIKNSSALLERARWAITIFRKRYFADLYLSEEEANDIEDIAEIQLMKANDEAIGRRYANFKGSTFEVTYRESVTDILSGE